MEDQKKRIAFLVLAHTDPNQLKRLCKSLDDERFDIYVHLDERKDINDFGFDDYCLKHSKLHVLKNRVKVLWADISVTDALISLYSTAFKNGPYCRYVTLSGLDFPIKSNDEIYSELSKENIEFIKGNPIRGKELHKIQVPCFWKLGKLGRGIHRVLMSIGLKRTRKLIVNGKELTIYFAPTWSALSGEFVAYMLERLKDGKIRKFFCHSYASDELLIPTILFNNERFKRRALASDFPEGTHYNEKPAVHYINYDPVIEVFDENSFDKLVSSGKLFFRKCVTGKSDRLVRMILEARDGM